MSKKLRNGGSNGQYLSPWVLQIFGLALLIAAAIFWAVTKQQSALIMGAAVSMIGLGAYKGAQETLRKHNLPSDEDDE